MNSLKPLRIFISSPGDVAEERSLCDKVIRRLSGEFAHRVTIEPIFWEHEPLRASASFQDEILLPSETDIVISILWTRLGTRLPDKDRYKFEDSELPATGTEFEVRDALNAFEKYGNPDLLIYLKTAEPLVSLKNKDELNRRLEQEQMLENFKSQFFFNKDGSIARAFHSFEESVDFETILEDHLRKLLDRKAPPETTDIKQKPTWTDGSPFRGLQRFDPEHASIFFGRNSAVSAIMSRLKILAADNRHFLLIQGMSGSGKSSLACAGVLPLLIEPGVIEGIGLWRYAIAKPSDSHDLFYSLAIALTSEAALPELLRDGTTVEEITDSLTETKAIIATLKGALREISSICQKEEQLDASPQSRMVLILDQLEEVFTQENISEQQREQFFDVIAGLAKSGLVWIIGTLRSDFYHRCEELPSLMMLKEGMGQYHLQPPTAVELGQMIRMPAQAAGIRFEKGIDGTGLDEVILEQALKSPEALPLLEFCLQELYETGYEDFLLSFEEYEQIGRFEGALSRKADQTLAELPTDAQESISKVMRRLVAIEEDSAVRRWYLQDELTDIKGASELIESFKASRLLVTQGKGGKARIALAHEVLIRNWPRLVKIIEMDREFLILRGRVEQSAQLWQSQEKDISYLLPAGRALNEALPLIEDRPDDLDKLLIDYINLSKERADKNKRLKKTLSVSAFVILTVLTTVSVIMGIKAHTNAKDALRQREKAEEQTTIAEKATYRAVRENKKATESLFRLYSEKFEQAISENKLDEAIAWGIERKKLKISNQEQSRKAELALKYAINQSSRFLWLNKKLTGITDVHQTAPDAPIWINNNSDKLFVCRKGTDDNYIIEDETALFQKVYDLCETTSGSVYANTKEGIFELKPNGEHELLFEQDGLLDGITAEQGENFIVVSPSHYLVVSAKKIQKKIPRKENASGIWSMVYHPRTHTLIFTGTENKQRKLYAVDMSAGELVYKLNRQSFSKPMFVIENTDLYYGPASENLTTVLKIDLTRKKDPVEIRLPFSSSGVCLNEGKAVLVLERGELYSLSQRQKTAGFTVDKALNLAVKLPSGWFLQTDDAIEFRPKNKETAGFRQNAIRNVQGVVLFSNNTTGFIGTDELHLMPEGEENPQTAVAFDIQSWLMSHDRDYLMIKEPDRLLKVDHRGNIAAILNLSTQESLLKYSGDRYLLESSRDYSIDQDLTEKELVSFPGTGDIYHGEKSFWRIQKDKERQLITFTEYAADTYLKMNECKVSTYVDAIQSDAFDPDKRLYVLGKNDGAMHAIHLPYDMEAAEVNPVEIRPSGTLGINLVKILKNDTKILCSLKGGSLERWTKSDGLDTWHRLDTQQPFASNTIEEINILNSLKIFIRSGTTWGIWKMPESCASETKHLPVSTVKGRYTAAISNELIAVPQDVAVEIHFPDGTKNLATSAKTGDKILEVTWSPDGKRLVGEDEESGILIWNRSELLDSKRTRTTPFFPASVAIRQVEFINNDTLVVLTVDGVFRIKLDKNNHPTILDRISLPKTYDYIVPLGDDRFAAASEKFPELIIGRWKDKAVTISQLPQKARTLAAMNNSKGVLIGGSNSIIKIRINEMTAALPEIIVLPKPKHILGEYSYYARSIYPVKDTNIALAGGKSVIHLLDLNGNCCFFQIRADEYVWGIQATGKKHLFSWQGEKTFGTFSLPDMSQPVSSSTEDQMNKMVVNGVLKSRTGNITLYKTRN